MATPFLAHEPIHQQYLYTAFPHTKLTQRFTGLPAPKRFTCPKALTVYHEMQTRRAQRSLEKTLCWGHSPLPKEKKAPL